MPTLYMLIGIPGSGKSTWVDNAGFDVEDTVIISTDKFIETDAVLQGKTYSEVFDGSIKRATQMMNLALDMAVKDRMNIVWDQTNLTKKSRAGKLSKIPNTYHKVAVVFATPNDDELNRRLAGRPGKTIPSNIILAMKSQLQIPSEEEGFEDIINVG